jgi:hypothetical protein
VFVCSFIFSFYFIFSFNGVSTTKSKNKIIEKQFDNIANQGFMVESTTKNKNETLEKH